MQTVDIDDAAFRLSTLIEAVSRGDKILTATAGKPAAMLVPVHGQQHSRTAGSMEGKIHVADDFDAPLPDELQSTFEGR